MQANVRRAKTLQAAGVVLAVIGLFGSLMDCSISAASHASPAAFAPFRLLLALGVVIYGAGHFIRWHAE